MAIHLKASDALHLSASLHPNARGAVEVESQLEAPFMVDRWHASLESGAKALGRKAEALAGRGAVGQLVQFGVGASTGLLAIPNGLYQVIRHPIATLQGLWDMASHVPFISPMWLLRALRSGPQKALTESTQFWAQVGQAWLAPFRSEWQAGRYSALAGRLVTELALLLIGARQLKAALESRALAKAGQASKAMPTANGAKALRQAASRGAPKGLAQASNGLGEAQNLKQIRLQRLKTQGIQKRPSMSRVEAFHKLRQGGRPKALQWPEEVGTLAKEKATFRRLRMLGPERLKADASIKRCYQRFVAQLDLRMDRELEALLGQRPQGLPKRADRAAEKLSLWRKDKPNTRLGAVDDIARGRLDLESFDLAEIRAMHDRLRQHFGPQRLKVNDHLVGNAMYRGRLHVKIKDLTGAWYELQIGPKQLSQFYERPMRVAGIQSNLHDLVYKGLLRLDDEAIQQLGQGNLSRGQARIQHVVNAYQKALTQSLEAASAGKEWPVHLADDLQAQLEPLLGSLPERLLPSALKP